MRQLLKNMQQVALRPQQFFRDLEAHHVRLWPSFWAGLISYLGLWLYVGSVGAWGSNSALLPVVAAALLIGGLLYGYVWGVGGVIFLRQLDARAWELLGWSWSATITATVSFIPPLILLVMAKGLGMTISMWLLGLGVGLMVVGLWRHVQVLLLGMAVFLPQGGRVLVMWYLILIYGVPAMFVLGWFGWMQQL